MRQCLFNLRLLIITFTSNTKEQMKISDSIPKISSIAVILILLYLLNIFGGYLLSPYLTSIFGMEEYGQYTSAVSIATIVNLVLGFLLNIILSIWAYKETKKHNENPVTWAAFTLFFGLIAIVLFYLFLLINELKKLNQNLDNRDK
jgi:O-antigen/teichoic acid export membrane protein